MEEEKLSEFLSKCVYNPSKIRLDSINGQSCINGEYDVDKVPALAKNLPVYGYSYNSITNILSIDLDA